MYDKSSYVVHALNDQLFFSGLAPWGSPLPQPEQGGEQYYASPPAPAAPGPGLRAKAPAAPGPLQWGEDDQSTGTDGEFDQRSGDGDSEVRRHSPAASPPQETIKWCAVREEEVGNCRSLVSGIGHSSNYTWTW